jgi:hypothetical protein
MYSQERHGSIALYVISPELGKKTAKRAKAIVPEVFHDDVEAGKHVVSLPAKIGSVVLREGHVVHGMGNKGAHNAAELNLDLQSLYCDPDDTWLTAEHGRRENTESSGT